MRPGMIAGFVDELEKISGVMDVLRSGAKGVGNAVRSGWHGSDQYGRSMNGAGWMASNDKTRNPIMSRIPLGNKMFTAFNVASQAPGVFAKEDPSGMGASRTERGLALAGQTAGGLAASGLMARAHKFRQLNSLSRKGGLKGGAGLLGSIVAQGAVGMAGSALGKKILTAPFARSRARRLAAMQQQQQGQVTP